MKKTLLSTVVMAIAAMFCLNANGQTESVLDNLTFEAPAKLIRPKGEWINVRTQPSLSAAKAKDKWGYEKGVTKHEILGVEQENAGWYRIGKDQWISKTVSTPVQPRPITEGMMNRFFGWSQGYDDWSEWTISPVGNKGFYIYMCGTSLRLGKMVGNVLVFKYTLELQNIVISEQPADAKKFNIETDTYDGEVRYTLVVGTNYTREMRHAQLTDRFINLQLFNDKVIERLFKEKIEKNQVDYMYITSDLLSGEYENYELG